MNLCLRSTWDGAPWWFLDYYHSSTMLFAGEATSERVTV